jgi:nucleotide-binding universal stress UspA family protein
LIAVSDVWLSESSEEFADAVAARRHAAAISGLSSHAPALKTWEEERVLSREARERIAFMFPLWSVRVETLPGLSLVSREILEKAERWNADVIVLGVQDIFAAETTGYGAGALRVVKDAGCNVFLARETRFGGSRANNHTNENLPVRIIVALNGTDADADIVRSATRRKWATGSEARIITIDAAMRSPMNEAQAADTLHSAGFDVSTMMPESDARSALVQASLGWSPHYIFAGGEPRDLSSETAEILRLTKCSVQLIRRAQVKPKVMGVTAGN